MNDLGIGEVLEKLIEVLQLEGHEIFRIFTEVQPAIAICNGIVVLFGIVGFFLGGYLGCKYCEKDKDDKDSFDDDDIVFIIIIALVGLIISLLLSGVCVHIYMHINYPEYFAVKDLINQIGRVLP